MAIRIGDKLTEIMNAKGVTQKQLSKATGLTASQLSYIQHNKRTPSLESFVKIADALYCKTDILLGRK